MTAIYKFERGRDHLVGEESPNEKMLRPFANFYGYGAQAEEGSLRRFEEHAKGIKETRILGITYEGGVFIFHCELGDIKGPVSDIPEWYMLPWGTCGADKEFISGKVSGNVYQGQLKVYESRPSKVQFWAASGHSGAICKVKTDP